jgi:hypothetical protein
MSFRQDRHEIYVATATATIPENITKVFLTNGGTNITLTMPQAQAGKLVNFSRSVGSTGGVTLQPPGGLIQALNGNMGANTSISQHNSQGAGTDIEFWSDGVNWYR